MFRQLSILAPVRYLWRFNSPRRSRHNIPFRTFLPLNYVSKKIEGITLFNPLPLKRFDLIHAFNRIPVSGLPFIIGFKSHLPRGFGMEKTRVFRLMTERLASSKCRAIIAISQSARQFFLRMHEGSPYYDALAPSCTSAAEHFHRAVGGRLLRRDRGADQNSLRRQPFWTQGRVRDAQNGGTGARPSATSTVRHRVQVRSRQQIMDRPKRRSLFPIAIVSCSLSRISIIIGSLPNDAVLELLRNAHFFNSSDIQRHVWL